MCPQEGARPSSSSGTDGSGSPNGREAPPDERQLAPGNSAASAAHAPVPHVSQTTKWCATLGPPALRPVPQLVSQLVPPLAPLK